VHILFITENFPPEVNAAATRVYERACYWVEGGHQVTVLTCFPNFPQGKLYEGYKQRLYQVDSMDGMRVVRLPTYIARNEGFMRRTLDFVSFMMSAVVAAPFQPRPDVVVATSPQFFSAVGGWLVSRLRRRPFVFELSDLWPASIAAVGALDKGWLLRMVERLELFLYRQSASVVALTQPFKDNLVSRGIPAGKIAVVINGVDLRRYEPRPRNAALAQKLGLSGRFVLGYIGTHGMAHALENIAHAAARLRHRKDIAFLLVGDGAARQSVVDLVAREQLDNVVLVPAQPKARMPEYWSLCDVALIHLKNDPVFADVIPSKIFEAMAMGLPLLAVCPQGEATRIVASCEAGWVIPPEVPDALADIAVALCADRARVQRAASRSLASAPRFSRQRQADDMLAVLEAVVEGNGSRASEALSNPE